MEQTMIAKLVGTLDDFGSDWAVLDVQGVGYLVHCSARTLSSLGVRGDRAAVFTQMQVSDSDVRLIGFSSAAERDWFRILMQVQGVGSKVALAILSVLSAEELQRACAQGDSATVARANGVGPKLATRIVNELKDKAGALPVFGGGGGDGASGSTLSVGASGADAISALQNLGFKPNIASAAVAHALEELEDGADLNTIIRVALKKAAG